MKVQLGFDNDIELEQIQSEISTNAKAITELVLEYFSVHDISHFLDSIKHQCHALQTLSINSCIFSASILSFVEAQPQLIHLQLEGCWRIPSESFNQYIETASIHNLKSLNLSGTQIDDSFLVSLSSKQNEIEDLNISFCHLVTDKGLTALLSSQELKHVKVLYLKCLKLSDLTLSTLSQQSDIFSNLVKLSLYKCYNCSSQGILNLLQSQVVNHIQYFDASSSHFCDLGLAAISQRKLFQQEINLKDLKTLKFYECSNITNEGVKTLFESELIERLEVLDLSWIYFENATLELLEQHKELKLRELSIPMNPSLQIETLFRFLKKSKILQSVEVLDVSYNQIDDSIVQYILDAKTLSPHIPIAHLLLYSSSHILNKKSLMQQASHLNILLYF